MTKRIVRIQPIERFPLNPRADGRFQKRIDGTLHYFTGNRAEAIAQYNAVKDDLYAGRVPKIAAELIHKVKVKDIANRCLRQKERDRDAGRISEGWYKKFAAALARFLAYRISGVRFSRRLWHNVGPEDFGEYARYLHGKLGVHAFNRERSCIAAMFNMAFDYGWMDKPMRLGKAFAKRPAADARATRKDWLLTPAAIAALYRAAPVQLRAMILLGLNGGFGPGDCAGLPMDKSYIEQARIRFRRPKNHIPRDMPIWPETIKAIRAVIAHRQDDLLVFRTKYGNPWTANSIAHEFAKLCKNSLVSLPKGVGLNSCRHTFATFANELQDRDAYKRLMGRKIADGIDETYVDAIFLPRLKRVVNHVRHRLQIRKIILAARKRPRPRNRP